MKEPEVAQGEEDVTAPQQVTEPQMLPLVLLSPSFSFWFVVFVHLPHS